MVFSENDRILMKRCLSLAKKGEGMVSPNPIVGSVIVLGGKIVGEGWHERFGGPHAEANALQMSREKAVGATMYVSLEPCSHTGDGKKTPPCAQAIVRSGVKRVVVAVADPNPKVSGNGISMLREAGIRVDVGLLEKSAKEINEPFFKFMKTRMPFVVLKIAQGKGGAIGIRGGGNVRISGPEFDMYAHGMRNRYDAVLAGISTVIADDPRLTCRLAGGRNPARIILDSNLRIPLDAKVLGNCGKEKVVIAASERCDLAKKAELERIGAIVLECGGARVDLERLLQRLPELGIFSVLVEGGAKVAESFVEAKLADKLVLCVSEKELPFGSPIKSPFTIEGAKKLIVHATEKKFGQDVVIEGYFKS